VVPGGRFDMVKADLVRPFILSLLMHFELLLTHALQGFQHNVAAQLEFLRRVIVTQAV
jgi:hypothetical protein